MKRLYHSELCLTLGVLCLFSLLPCRLTRADESTDRIVTEEAAAYAVLVKADEARDRHEFQAASDHYKKASELYTTLSQAAPGWEPDVIQYRLVYCADQIQSIKRQLAAGNKRVFTPSTARPKRPAEIFDGLIQENESLHRSLVDIQSRLNNLEGANDLKTDLQKLADENGQFYRALVDARAEADKDPNGAANSTRKYEQKNESLKSVFLTQKNAAEAFIRQNAIDEEEEWKPEPKPAPVPKTQTPAAVKPAPKPAVPVPPPPQPKQEIASKPIQEEVPTAPQPVTPPPSDDEDIFAPVPMGNVGDNP